MLPAKVEVTHFYGMFCESRLVDASVYKEAVFRIREGKNNTQG